VLGRPAEGQQRIRAVMEDVLVVYTRSRDADCPLISWRLLITRLLWNKWRPCPI
jgi:hypothetical protein